jgi:hypothetical protein
LRPHGDIDRKRVTLLYRPIDSARAARIVEQDKRNADFRVNFVRAPVRARPRRAARGRRDRGRGGARRQPGELRDARDRDRHERGAPRRGAPRDRAPGADGPDHAATCSRLADSAFAAALPLGLVLPSHLRVPAELRESL